MVLEVRTYNDGTPVMFEFPNYVNSISCDPKISAGNSSPTGRGPIWNFKEVCFCLKPTAKKFLQEWL